MYSARHDDQHRLAVWILDRPTPEEWRRFTVDIVRVAHWIGEPRPSVILSVAHFAPDARQAAHFADLFGDPSFRARVAIVASGALAEGFLRLIESIDGGAQLTTSTVLDVEDGLAWLGESPEVPLGMLALMHREAWLDRPPERATEPA